MGKGNTKCKDRFLAHESRTDKLANQPLLGHDTADNSTTSYTFNRVFAIPCNQVVIVDDELFAGCHLYINNVNSCILSRRSLRFDCGATYVLLYNCSQTSNKQNTFPANFNDE